jgi:hypothetical protein
VCAEALALIHHTLKPAAALIFKNAISKIFFILLMYFGVYHNVIGSYIDKQIGM